MRGSKRNAFRLQNGFTAIELLFTIIILGTLVPLITTGVHFFNNTLRATSQIGMEQAAESSLYNMVREVRGAQSLVQISSDTLVMRVCNPRLGYDVANINIFDSVNVGTITYQFTQGPGGEGLLWTVNWPAAGGLPAVNESKLLFKDILVPPDQNNYIFKTTGTGLPPYTGVEVVLQVGTARWFSQPKTLRTVIELRRKSFV